MSAGYEKAIRECIPQAEVAFDPFHLVRLAQRVVDQVRRDQWNAHERSHTAKGPWIKGTRWSLLKAPAKHELPERQSGFVPTAGLVREAGGKDSDAPVVAFLSVQAC
jgi:transposase